jgi:hypothetical protein
VDPIFQIVVPAHGLLFWPIGIHLVGRYELCIAALVVSLYASQTICQRCGRQHAPIASYARVSYQRNRVYRHMYTVAIIWIAYSF